MAQVHLTLDDALVAQAEARGDLAAVVEQALRLSQDPQEAIRRRRWLEDNALLIEAARGALEAA